MQPETTVVCFCGRNDRPGNVYLIFNNSTSSTIYFAWLKRLDIIRIVDILILIADSQRDYACINVAF